MGIVGIVARGFGVGAEILYFISEIGESADDGLFQLVAGVVGAYGDYGGRCGELCHFVVGCCFFCKITKFCGTTADVGQQTQRCAGGGSYRY